MKSECDITPVNACISCFLGSGMKMDKTISYSLYSADRASVRTLSTVAACESVNQTFGNKCCQKKCKRSCVT